MNWQAQSKIPWVRAAGVQKRRRLACKISPVTSVSVAILFLMQVRFRAQREPGFMWGLQTKHSCQCFDRVAAANSQSPRIASVCHFMHQIIVYNLTVWGTVKVWYEFSVLDIQFWISACAQVHMYTDFLNKWKARKYRYLTSIFLPILTLCS